MSRDSTIAIQFLHLMGRASSFFAVLMQRSGRSPYTPRSNVATQRQGCHRGNSLRCVAFHSFTHALQFSRFLVRYPSANDSKRIEKLGVLSLLLISNQRTDRNSNSCQHHNNYENKSPAYGCADVLRFNAPRSQPSWKLLSQPLEQFPCQPYCNGDSCELTHKPQQIRDSQLCKWLVDFFHTSAQQQRNRSENSDFHRIDPPKTRGSLTAAPFFGRGIRHSMQSPSEGVRHVGSLFGALPYIVGFFWLRSVEQAEPLIPANAVPCCAAAGG